MKIITNPSGYPVSVIIPLQEKRKYFFENYVLPLLEANHPVEIIIHDGEGNAAKKRNEGFKKSTQPYVLFLDDDKLLPMEYIVRLYEPLCATETPAFSYTGYTGIVLHPATHPVKCNYKIPTEPFDVNALKRNNYIDTTSLIRREAFPGFDETLEQHDDWDLYLHMVKNGHKGIAVKGLEFFSFFLDEGITSVNNTDCTKIIREKYSSL